MYLESIFQPPTVMTTDLPSEERIHEALRDVIDPEVGLNVEDLGLVYAVSVTPERIVVTMTMTTPACPMGPMIVEDAESRVRAISPPDAAVEVELVWMPPWTPARMSEEARRTLGFG